MSRLREVIRKVTGFTWYRSLPTGLDPLADIFRKTRIKPSIVFDVGANRGQSATYFRSKLPEARILSFEPVASTFRVLQSTSKRIGAESYQVGFGSRVEQKKIRVHANPSRSVSNSFYTTSGGDETVEEMIDVETIDHFMPVHGVEAIDYLKIDTEGNDLEVLKGAVDALGGQAIKFVEVEAGMNSGNTFHVPFAQLHAFLEAHHYSVFGIYRQVHEGGTRIPILRRANVVFISQRLANQFR